MSDGEWTYTWQHGRQLTSMSKGTATWTYTYDANGLRTKKTDGSHTYTYVYNGSLLTSMSIGSDKYYFTYDASGTPFTIAIGSMTYYYVTNLQGDVIGILNSSGEQVVSYAYDAWGNVSVLYGRDPIVDYNPLLYRGYVYDDETGLYYLQSRYYNPRTGRFTNADAYATTGQGFVGNNMFVYCLNNPASRFDDSGCVSKDTADKIIEQNKEAIFEMAERYDVDPVAIAVCIYTEQVENVNWVDDLTDEWLCFLDTSIGIGQVKISTALKMEDLGYVTYYLGNERFSPIKSSFFNSLLRKYNTMNILQDDKSNIMYVAAYLRYHQDTWAPFCNISDKPGILATLYNTGYKKPHAHPKCSTFGTKAEQYYDHVKKILYS